MWIRTLVVASWLAQPSLAAVHPGPSIFGDLKFADGQMIFTIEGAADPVQTNFQLDTLPIGPLSEEVSRSIEAQVERYFREHNPVTIDGEPVLPTLTSSIIQDGVIEEASWKSARFVLAYACPEIPQKISMRWDRFEGEGIEFIPVVINIPDATPQMFSMWPDEPEYIWHSSDVKRRRAAEFKPIETSSKGKVELPLPSVGIVLAAFLSIFLFRFVGWTRAAVGVPLAALVVAAALRDVGRAEVEVPWKTRVHLPAPEQARSIFQALHNNIYAAFELDDEDSIYELLATSIEIGILDDLYGDVYESLVLREQGGAVCSVEGVDFVSGEVDVTAYEEAVEPQYKVDWEWRVHGIVSHYGHIHRRMNEYQAEYTVRHDGASWKIAAVDVKHHRRVEDFE